MDCPNDNAPLWAALMNKNESPAEIAAMMNNSNFNNNPFIWLVFLMLFRNGGLWGANGADAVGENRIRFGYQQRKRK